MNDFPGNYYYQVAIIFTNRLLGCCSCLGVLTWHFPGCLSPEQVQGLVRAATPTWFGATTSSPFPAASCALLMKPELGHEGTVGHSTSKQEQAALWEEQEQQELPCSEIQPAQGPCWVSHRGFSMQPLQRMARLEIQPAAVFALLKLFYKQASRSWTGSGPGRRGFRRRKCKRIILGVLGASPYGRLKRENDY